MPKRKRSAKGPGAEASTATETVMVAPLPSDRLKVGISAVVILHLSALVIALSANLAPSFLHGELLAWLAPLHVTTGQDYILLPLELTHADEIEAPLVIEVTRSNEPEWVSLALTGKDSSKTQAVFNSRWPNASRLLSWIANQQPESDVLPEFAARAIRLSETFSGKDAEAITAIRFYQPHVLSFDEDLVIDQGQGKFIAETLSGEVVYAADVVYSADGQIGLIPEQEAALTSKAVASEPSAQESSAP